MSFSRSKYLANFARGECAACDLFAPEVRVEICSSTRRSRKLAPRGTKCAEVAESRDRVGTPKLSGALCSFPSPQKKIGSGDIPNSTRSRRTSWNPGGTRWNLGGTLVEPWWNPRGTFPPGRPGPPRSLSGLRPQSFQLLGKKSRKRKTSPRHKTDTPTLVTKVVLLKKQCLYVRVLCAVCACGWVWVWVCACARFCKVSAPGSQELRGQTLEVVPCFGPLSRLLVSPVAIDRLRCSLGLACRFFVFFCCVCVCARVLALVCGVTTPRGSCEQGHFASRQLCRLKRAAHTAHTPVNVCQVVSAPAQAHPLSTAHTAAKR